MSAHETASVGSVGWRSPEGHTAPPRSNGTHERATSELEFKLRRQSSVIMQADSRVKELESLLTLCQTREQQLREECSGQVMQLESQLQLCNKQLSVREAELERVEGRVRERESELAACRARVETVRQQVSLDMMKKYLQHTALSDKLTQDLSECRQQLKECQLEALQQQQRYELQLLQLSNRPPDVSVPAPSDPTQQQQLDSANKRIQELEAALESASDDVQFAKVLRHNMTSHQQLVDRNRQMEAELKSLRGLADRSLLLQEQLVSAELKLQVAEKNEHQLQLLRAQSETEGGQLREWLQIAAECQVEPSAEAVRAVIVELRSQQLLLTDQLCHARASAEDGVSEASQLRDSLAQCEARLHDTKQQLNTSALQHKKLQRKLNLVSMERDSLQSILSSYESETSVTVTCIERQKLEALQRCLHESRRQTEQLELQLLQLAPSADSCDNQQEEGVCARLTAQLEQLRAELAEAKQHNAQLSDELEERALRGDYNPTKTRVLSLRENPASSASSSLSGQLQSLRQQNSSLQQRVAQLSQQLQTAAAGSQAAPAAHSQCVSELQSRVQSAEQRACRLKEVFGRSVQQLRHSVCMLTGFKISSDCQQIKLRSVYSTQPDHFLRFQRDSDDSIHLLETEMSSSHQQLLQTYLWRCDSIPCFLAALQLHLFSEQDRSSHPHPHQQQQQQQQGTDRAGTDPEVLEID